MESLSELPLMEEIQQAAGTLRRLPRGFLPNPIFIEVARLVVTPTIELAPLRLTDNEHVEIFLTKRPENDPHWPGGWHIPGTVIRSTDREDDFSSAFDRVRSDELGTGLEFVSEPQLVGIKFWDVARGRELDMMHYVEVKADNGVNLTGKFFDSDHLPDETLIHHKIIIPEIVTAFLSKQTSK